MKFEQRLADFPTQQLEVRQPVQIRWNRQAVLYIEAQSAEDAAYALGLVHYYLRSSQLEVALRLAQGRVSEMLGSPAVGLDHALRLLDLRGRPGPAKARCHRTRGVGLNASSKASTRHSQALPNGRGRCAGSVSSPDRGPRWTC